MTETQVSATEPTPPSPRRDVDIDALLRSAGQGTARAVARLISLIEDGHPVLPALASALTAYPRRAHLIGITGSPGVGKSTTVDALVTAYRAQGSTVGVLAVDPSSPFSGGALLGDRVRMQQHALDARVFIRSMASRGHLGGLAAATGTAARVLDAARCDVVLIETVGVGQSEVEVAALSDTTLVLLAPGMGDGIQAAKAGIIEVGDVFAVNKADRDGARATVREVRQVTGYADRERHGSWRPPVLATSAIDGTGISDLVAALDRHHTHCATSGELVRRRTRRATAEVTALALGGIAARLRRPEPQELLTQLAARIVQGDLDPYTAAELMLAELT